MSVDRRSQALGLAVLLVGLAVPSAADKLDKKDKEFLETVAPIILPDEEKQFKDLKKGDRDDFIEIFWARRDPDLETPENEFKAEFDKRRAEAEGRYRVFGRGGARTDCGRVFILLGEPDVVKSDGREPQPGHRTSETWTYRDRGVYRFPGGSADFSFDDGCSLPQGSRSADFFKNVAESKIAQSNLQYKTGANGHLVKLQDLLPKPSPSQALLKEPRQDFALEMEPTLVLKTEGGAYVAGLVRGHAEGLHATDVGGKKMIKLTIVSQTVDAEGRAQVSKERQSTVEVGEGGSFLSSFGLALRPGSYTLKVGVLDPESGLGSAASLPVEAPNFGSGELSASEVAVLREIQETGGGAPSEDDPLRDFALGPFRLVPKFGRQFTKDESVVFLCAIYGAAVDPASGKPSVKVGLAIYHGAKKVGEAPIQTYDAPNPTHSVGPVPLGGFEAGEYTVKVRVQDEVAGTEITRENTFKISSGSAAAEPAPGT